MESPYEVDFAWQAAALSSVQRVIDKWRDHGSQHPSQPNQATNQVPNHGVQLKDLAEDLATLTASRGVGVAFEGAGPQTRVRYVLRFGACAMLLTRHMLPGCVWPSLCVFWTRLSGERRCSTVAVVARQRQGVPLRQQLHHLRLRSMRRQTCLTRRCTPASSPSSLSRPAARCQTCSPCQR